MSCERMELAIALYVEGDLPSLERPEVEAHLTRCTACAEFERELLASQIALKDLAHETMDESVFRIMRARVMEESTGRGRRWFPVWLFAPLTAVAAAVFAIALIPAGVVEGPVPPSAPQAPVVVASRFTREPVRRAPVRRPRPKAVTRESVMLQLVSDDPDIVIYWLVD